MIKKIFIIRSNNINLLDFKKNNNLILSDILCNNIYDLSKIIGIFQINKDNYFFVSTNFTLFKIKN